MAIRRVEVQRFSVISSKTFGEVMASLEAAIGHPEMTMFLESVASAKTYANLEKAVAGVTGPSGLMEFVRFDLGEVLRKGGTKNAPRSLRLLVGNPLIMRKMVEQVPDAGSYAPVTILIDERPDGVHLSYDRMASFLSSYASSEALQVARDLDAKVESLLTKSASA